VVRPGRWATPKNERKKKVERDNEGGAVPKAQTLKKKKERAPKKRKEKKNQEIKQNSTCTSYDRKEGRGEREEKRDAE